MSFLRRDSMTVSIVGWVVVAVLVGGSTTTLLLWLLGWPSLPRSAEFTTAQTLDLLKIALAVVAGFGGVVILSVNHRRQRFTEKDHRLALARDEREESKLLNERFAVAAEQLAHERAQVRLAGVYALASLADDWDDGRQKCVDVLMSYLRLSRPASRVPGSGEDEVLDTIFRVFRDRMSDDSSWNVLDFDFTGMKLLDMDFSGFRFLGTVTFDDVVFAGAETSFAGARIHGEFRCHGTKFTTAVDFGGAYFTGEVSFTGARFAHRLNLFDATVLDGTVEFSGCVFSGEVNGSGLGIGPGTVRFAQCVFQNAPVDFEYAEIGAPFDLREWYEVLLNRPGPARGALHFTGCELHAAKVDLTRVSLAHGRLVLHDLTVRGGRLRVTPIEAAHPSLDLRRIRVVDAEVDLPLPERIWGVPPETGDTPQPD